MVQKEVSGQTEEWICRQNYLVQCHFVYALRKDQDTLAGKIIRLSIMDVDKGDSHRTKDLVTSEKNQTEIISGGTKIWVKWSIRI